MNGDSDEVIWVIWVVSNSFDVFIVDCDDCFDVKIVKEDIGLVIVFFFNVKFGSWDVDVEK